ncbi:MAG: GNAT family protein [Candidatus Nanopelagicales bacterium]
MTEPREPRSPVTVVVGPYLLDSPRVDDVDAVEAALRDPDIALWNPSARRGMSARERARLWVAERAAWDDDHASWVVRDLDGTVIGQVSLHQLDPVNGSGEVGYWLTPAGRGRGVATAALDAAARFAFDVLELARVELFHAVENEASCRVAQRAGFLLEGTARQSFVYGDGHRHDEHLHARLATDPDPDLDPL